MKEVLDSLGDPKVLGRAYGGKTVVNTEKYNSKHFARTLAYYSATGIGGFILSVLAGALYLSAFMVLLGGFLKTVGTALGFDMAFVSFNVGAWQMPDLLALPISIPVALVFYYCSKRLWKVLKVNLSRRL